MHVSAASAASSGANSAVGSQQEVSTDTFLKLLTEELKHQDPLEPLTSEQMLTQISQLTTVGEISKLNQNFETMASAQGAALMATLIGRAVEWTDATGAGVRSGVVERVQLGQDGWSVAVGGVQVPVESIQAVQ